MCKNQENPDKMACPGSYSHGRCHIQQSRRSHFTAYFRFGREGQNVFFFFVLQRFSASDSRDDVTANLSCVGICRFTGNENQKLLFLVIVSSHEQWKKQRDMSQAVCDDDVSTSLDDVLDEAVDDEEQDDDGADTEAEADWRWTASPKRHGHSHKDDSDSDDDSDNDPEDPEDNDREWWNDDNDRFWACSQREQQSQETRQHPLLVCGGNQRTRDLETHTMVRVPAVVNLLDWRSVATRPPWPELLRYKKVLILDRPLVSAVPAASTQAVVVD